MIHTPTRGDDSLEKVKKSFRHLLEGDEIPKSIREELSKDFDDLRAMLDKLEGREFAHRRSGVGWE